MFTTVDKDPSNAIQNSELTLRSYTDPNQALFKEQFSPLYTCSNYQKLFRPTNSRKTLTPSALATLGCLHDRLPCWNPEHRSNFSALSSHVFDWCKIIHIYRPISLGHGTELLLHNILHNIYIREVFVSPVSWTYPLLVQNQVQFVVKAPEWPFWSFQNGTGSEDERRTVTLL